MCYVAIELCDLRKLHIIPKCRQYVPPMWGSHLARYPLPSRSLCSMSPACFLPPTCTAHSPTLHALFPVYKAWVFPKGLFLVIWVSAYLFPPMRCPLTTQKYLLQHSQALLAPFYFLSSTPENQHHGRRDCASRIHFGMPRAKNKGWHIRDAQFYWMNKPQGQKLPMGHVRTDERNLVEWLSDRVTDEWEDG